MTAAINEMNASNRLRDILYAGVAPDIHLAERARELHRAVGGVADSVNEAGFGELFATVQNAAVSELTLSVAKIFERPSRRFPTRSLPAAFWCLRDHAGQLHPLQPDAAMADFARAGLEVATLKSLKGEDYNRELARLLEVSCPDPAKSDACGLSRALAAMRSSRDKAIAHNEVVDRGTLPKAKWVEAEALLRYAKDVMGGMAMVFFASAWTDDSGHFAGSDDAQVAATQLRRLLKAANIGPVLASSDR